MDQGYASDGISCFGISKIAKCHWNITRQVPWGVFREISRGSTCHEVRLASDRIHIPNGRSLIPLAHAIPEQKVCYTTRSLTQTTNTVALLLATPVISVCCTFSWPARRFRTYKGNHPIFLTNSWNHYPHVSELWRAQASSLNHRVNAAKAAVTIQANCCKFNLS